MNSEEMQAAFKKYDQNGDGTIDRDGKFAEKTRFNPELFVN